MTTATLPTHTATQVDRLWREIVRKHHEAKSLARCGENQQAIALLRDALPPLIRHWGRISGLPRHLQMLRLRKLIQGDLRHVLQPRPARHEQLSRAAAAPENDSYRIPLSDITGMIDAVQIAEAQARHSRQDAWIPLAS